jgi:cell division protein ZipA
VDDQGRQLVDGVYLGSKRVVESYSPYDSSLSEKKTEQVTFFKRNKASELQPQAKSTSDQQPEIEIQNNSVVMKSDDTQNDNKLIDELNVDTTNIIDTIIEKPVLEEPSEEKDSSDSSAYGLATKQNIKVVYHSLPDGVNELIISHTILAKNKHFNGAELYHALEVAGLVYGEMNIYHYPANEEKETFALFSVANVIEPGTFNPQEPDNLTTPGISMFMRLPTPIDNNEAYEEFIHVAQLLAAELDGELCDETRSQLTQQAVSYKKEQIRKLNFELTKAEKLAGTR